MRTSYCSTHHTNARIVDESNSHAETANPSMPMSQLPCLLAGLQRKSNGVQIPYPRASHRWSYVAVDLAAALRQLTTSPLIATKSIQYCSWLTVRGAYTSDFNFRLEVRGGRRCVCVEGGMWYMEVRGVPCVWSLHVLWEARSDGGSWPPSQPSLSTQPPWCKGCPSAHQQKTSQEYIEAQDDAIA